MSRARREVEQLEEMVVSGRKKFVRYAEGAQLYSLGFHTFQEIAKEANAVYRVKNRTNLDCKYGMVGTIMVLRQVYP